MRTSILSVLSLTLACSTDSAKVDSVDNNPNSSEFEQSTDASTDSSDSETSTEIDDELRCCYGIEMIDYGGNGLAKRLAICSDR